MTSETSSARAAANSRASARGCSSTAGSSSRDRTRSPAGVPPGSRVTTTSRARPSSACRSRASWVDLPAPSTPSKAIRRPGSPMKVSDADQLGHPDLGAALGAGGGVRVLVGGEQAAAVRAGLGQRRLPEGEVAVGVAVAAVEGLAALGPLGDDLALAALGTDAVRLLAQVLDALALGVVGAAQERPEAAAALDHRLAALGAGHVGQLGLGLLGGLLGRLVGVAPVLAVRVAAAGQEPAVPAPLADQLGPGLLAAGGADLVGRLLGPRDLLLALGDGALDLLEEGPDDRLPRLGPAGDAVQVLLHLGGEAEVDDLGEDVGEQVGDHDADVLGVEALAVQADVLAVHQGRDGRRVGRRTADAVLLQRLDQAGLAVAGRRLGEVLLGGELDQPQHLARDQLGQGAGLLLGLVVAALQVYPHEPVEAQHRPGGPEGELAGVDVDAGLVVDGLGHLGGHGPLPDQVVQPALGRVEVGGDRLGGAGDHRRADPLVGLLGLLGLGLVLGPLDVVGAVALGDQAADVVLGGRGQGRGVGAHVGDEPDRALTGQVDALVQLLGHGHGPLGGEPELAGGLLLEGGGDERGRGAALALALVDPGDRPGGSPGGLGGGGGRALVAEDELLLLAHRVAGVDRLGGLGGQVGLQAPVLAGLEGVDLALAVDDHLERGRLDPAGRQAGPDLAPQHRRQLVADDPVDHPAGLLGVDQAVVDVAGVGEGPPDGVGGDLGEGDPAGRAGGQLGRLGDVPGDRLALPVGVGGEEHLVGRLGGLADAGDDLLALLGHLVGDRDPAVDIHGEVGLGQVTDVAHGGDHVVVFAQVLADGLRLGRRLDHDQVACQWNILCSSWGDRAERRSVADHPPVLSRLGQSPVFPMTLHRAVHSPPQEVRWVVGRGSGSTGSGRSSAAGVARVTPPRRLERHSAQASRATATTATANRSSSSSARATTVGAISTATRFITLIRGLRAGPAVSLNGSPTVSPITVALWGSEFLPPWWPSSTYFLALSQAPPDTDSMTASSWPVRIAPAR